MESSAKIAERQNEYTRNDPVNKRDDVIEGREEPNTAEPDDAPREYRVTRIVRHISEGDNVRFVVRWYGYTSADDTVKPPEHIFEHLITRYWRRVMRNEVAGQLR